MTQMSQQPADADIEMDGANLYQEETFTDRRIGSLLRLTPVTASGASGSHNSAPT